MQSELQASRQYCNTFERFLRGCFKSTATATKQFSRGIQSPVTATRNYPCKVKLPVPEHKICNDSADWASEAGNINIIEHEIPTPATQKASLRTLFKSAKPANCFGTLMNPCACHTFCDTSKSLPLPRETHFEPQKLLRDPSTIWTSESLSRYIVVQIFATSLASAALVLRGYLFERPAARLWKNIT